MRHRSELKEKWKERKRMFCPFKMANSELESRWHKEISSYSFRNWDCEKGKCALWEEVTGTCSFHTFAYLKGIEVELKEKRKEE